MNSVVSVITTNSWASVSDRKTDRQTDGHSHYLKPLPSMLINVTASACCALIGADCRRCRRKCTENSSLWEGRSFLTQVRTWMPAVGERYLGTLYRRLAHQGTEWCVPRPQQQRSDWHRISSFCNAMTIILLSLFVAKWCTGNWRTWHWWMRNWAYYAVFVENLYL